MTKKIVPPIVSLFLSGCVVVDNSYSTPEITPQTNLGYIDTIMVDRVRGGDTRSHTESFREGIKHELQAKSDVEVAYRSPYRLIVRVNKTHLNQYEKKGKFLGSVQYRFIQDVVATADFDLIGSNGEVLVRDRAVYNGNMDTGSSQSFRDAREKADENIFRSLGERVGSRILKYLPPKTK